jgi:hypothetical protein
MIRLEQRTLTALPIAAESSVLAMKIAVKLLKIATSELQVALHGSGNVLVNSGFIST